MFYNHGMKSMNRLIFEALKYWLPAAVAATVLALLVAGAVQQNIRQGANDPQIQMAEDTATSLAGGRQPAAAATGKVDMARSLAPYTMVFDDAGRLLASGVELDGQTPEVPPGVFTYVRQHGEDRFTWQPQPGVRHAAVVVHYGGAHAGFVLAGRSMREVEKREDQLTMEVVLAWLAALVGTFVAAACAVLFVDALLARRWNLQNRASNSR